MPGVDQWFWEERNNGEFIPPNIASIGEGWEDWKGTLSDGPRHGSEIFVRELVQNFVDAAREQNLIRSSLKFHFVELTGPDAARVAGALRLDEHAQRYANLSVDDQYRIRLEKCDVLAGVLDPLRLLVVSETGTSGMSGPWEMNAENVIRKMRSALMSTVGTKSKTSLGAFGEGKRAIIAASLARTILVSTCFAEDPPITGKVTRRLLGATYWNVHSEPNGLQMTGLALLGCDAGSGRRADDRPKPLENEDADRFINQLDIPSLDPRDPADLSCHGTTYVFVDPNVEPEEIVESLERNWWPLISDQTVEFEVLNYGGQSLALDPRGRPELKPFVDIYTHLKSPVGGAASPVSETTKTLTFQSTVGPLGDIALSVDLSDGGWSWSERDTNVNLIALVRDGMLIQYLPSPAKNKTPPPFVRGVFVLDSTRHARATELLRLVEPPLHNRFSTDKYNPEGNKLATELYAKIHSEVREFRKAFRQTPEPRDDRFDDFSNAFSSPEVQKPVSVRPRPKPSDKPPKTKDPWTNRSGGATLEYVNDDQVKVHAIRVIALKGDWPDPSLKVRVRVSWEVQAEAAFQEDNQLFDPSGVTFSPEFKGQAPSGPNEWIGELSKTEVQVACTSNPYSGMWTVRPVIEISKEG